MRIQFFGAARSVTGSMHGITVGGKNILLECGLFQGRRRESIERNRNFPFSPNSISALILSHAHIDHSGNIPQLVRQGYKGPIFCTHATQDLCRIMLRDSAHLQEQDVAYLNKKRRRAGEDPVQPLYTVEDAERCMSLFVGIGYDRPFAVTPNVDLTFRDAGHILGSAVVVLDIRENRRRFRLAFTGDLGRKHLPVIRDPVQVDRAEILITESTYGLRVHESVSDMKERLREVVQDAVLRGGKIVVPAFSVGRTQELVYFLHELISEKAVPEIPIYVDSPLSANATEVFRMHPECFDAETKARFLFKNEDPFGFSRLRYIRDVEESKKLNDLSGPCMIISASGMCEGGRILHHLKQTIPDPRNTVLVVGFMAENTLGRRLVEKQPALKIFGEEIPLRARVETAEGFSAHADKNDLLSYVQGIEKNGLRRIFVVHGEPESALGFAASLRDAGYENVEVPEPGQTFEI